MRAGHAIAVGRRPHEGPPRRDERRARRRRPALPGAVRRFGGAASWQNMNMTPDFPTAARAALANVAAGGGPHLDGVVSADPQPWPPSARHRSRPRPGHLRSASATDDVVAFTTNEAYVGLQRLRRAQGGPRRPRGRRPRTVPLHAGQEPAPAPRARRRRGRRQPQGVRHRPRLPGRRSTAPAPTGAFARPEGTDQVAVTVNNGSANKVDYYATRTVDATIQLGGDHEAYGSMDVAIANDAPDRGAPPLRARTVRRGPGTGRPVPLISAWCADPCELLEARRDGQDTLVNADVEDGMAVLPGLPADRGRRRRAPSASAGTPPMPGKATPVTAPTASRSRRNRPSARRGDGDGRGAARVPIVWTSEPMAVEGDTADLVGDAPGRHRLEMRFRTSFLTRWWRSLTGVTGAAARQRKKPGVAAGPPRRVVQVSVSQTAARRASEPR